MFWSAVHIGSFRSMLRLGAPLILSQLALMGIGVIDSIMLGWYSVEALAASVLGHTVFFVIFIVGGGFGIAVMPLVASAIAQNAFKEARRVTCMGTACDVYGGVVIDCLLDSCFTLFSIQKPFWC